MAHPTTPPASQESYPYPLTSQTEMEAHTGKRTFRLLLDDTEEGTFDPTILDDIIEHASDEVFMRIERFYRPELAYRNRWVRSKATHIAINELSKRRGNPEMFASQAADAIAQLDQVHNGTLQIPRLPQRDASLPTVTNTRIDDRFWRRKARTQTDLSTGGSFPGMDPDTFPGIEY